LPDAHLAIFHEMAIILALATTVGIVGVLLKQPLLIAFIVAGILAGPAAFDLIRSASNLNALADIGVAVLLFLIGLKLDMHIIRALGRVATATGLGQVLFTSVVGFAICFALGFDALTSAYVAVALTFSSTIIIVKLLTDKREVDSLHGRIAIGFLIVQDIVVVVAMIALSAVGIGTSADSVGWSMPAVVGNSILLLAGLAVFMRWAAEPLVARIARYPELLVTATLTWAVLLAALADWIGLGKELGGLMAGFSLASTSFRDAIASRLTSLRDFLLLFFFLMLGSRLEIGVLGSQIFPALVLSLFVLIGNPLIVLAIMGVMGYRKRTGFLAGLTVAQISEFSLIFIAMGLSLGHVQQDAVSLVTLVGLVTIALSTYMIIYSHELYRFLEPLLGPFERQMTRSGEVDPGLREDIDMILFGLGRYGTALAQVLQNHGVRILGVDFDPEALARWRKRGFPGIFGDATDPEFPASLPLERASCVIIATPPPIPGTPQEDSRLIVKDALRRIGFKGKIALRTQDQMDGARDVDAGGDIVLSPFSDAATRAAELLQLDGGASQAGRAPQIDEPSTSARVRHA